MKYKHYYSHLIKEAKFKKGDKVKLTWASHDKAKNKTTGIIVSWNNRTKQYDVDVDGKISKFNEDEISK